MTSVPANRHLTWAEIRDFSPGLWEASDWLVPPGGAQTLTDAYPQSGGGLRAWFKPTTLASAGIGASERIIGFFAYGAPHRTLPTDAVDYYCVTYHSSTFVPRIYRWDQTDAAETQWRLMATLTAGANNSPQQVRFHAYVLTAGTIRIHASIGYSGSNTGIWAATQTLAGAAQVWAKLANSSGIGPMVIHQSRLCEAQGSKVYYTGAGDETINTANFVNVEPQRNLSGVRAMLATAPGDLLVATEGSVWASVQGDIASAPTVRTMSEGHPAGYYRQGLADTGQGIAFQENHGGTFLTDGGSSFARIDSQLVAPTSTSATIVTIGDLAFIKQYLVTPHGYVWDQETKAWFKSSWLSGASKGTVLFAERRLNNLFAVLDNSATIYTFPVPGTRVNSYTYKTPSLRNDDGRQVEVRQVQVILKSYVGTSSVTVTVNGTARTVGSIAAGRQALSFLFRERAEVLDVTVAPSSGDSSTEAPSIEAIRIGHRTGHLVP